MKHEPLYLPKGSVRAILAILTFFFTMVLLSVESLYADKFISLTSVIIGYYFGYRSNATERKEFNPYRET